MTPFKQGQSARRDGKPLSANPFVMRAVEGVQYPGEYMNWQAGWVTENAMIQHDERLKND